jgi:hypothetical protein
MKKQQTWIELSSDAENGGRENVNDQSKKQVAWAHDHR